MALYEITSNGEYEHHIKSSHISIIHFHAPWAEQCTQINDLLGELSESDDFCSIQFASVCAEEFPEMSLKYNISAVPTVLFFRNENLISRVDGANTKDIRNRIKKFQTMRMESTARTLEFEIQTLIGRAPCVLFIEGNQDLSHHPSTESIIDLMNRYATNFEIVDVSIDRKLRDSLAKHSNYYSYPQVYREGKFIGGLEAIHKLRASGELDEISDSKSLTLETRLKGLINSYDCMLFMKGDRANPRCGFSRKMITLLNDHNINYRTFNILEDEEVREGLKKFSNWPTYPQLYLDGELIGGLDIIMELNESGELERMLPKM